MRVKMETEALESGVTSWGFGPSVVRMIGPANDGVVVTTSKRTRRSERIDYWDEGKGGGYRTSSNPTGLCLILVCMQDLNFVILRALAGRESVS